MIGVPETMDQLREIPSDEIGYISKHGKRGSIDLPDTEVGIDQIYPHRSRTQQRLELRHPEANGGGQRWSESIRLHCMPLQDKQIGIRMYVWLGLAARRVRCG